MNCAPSPAVVGPEHHRTGPTTLTGNSRTPCQTTQHQTIYSDLKVLIVSQKMASGTIVIDFTRVSPTDSTAFSLLGHWQGLPPRQMGDSSHQTGKDYCDKGNRYQSIFQKPDSFNWKPGEQKLSHCTVIFIHTRCYHVWNKRPLPTCIVLFCPARLSHGRETNSCKVSQDFCISNSNHEEETLHLQMPPPEGNTGGD